MSLKSWILKPWIIRSYRNELRMLLLSEYGSLKKLTYPKIKAVMEKYEVNTVYEEYAYALFLKRSKFKDFQKKTGYPYSYDYLRIKLGDPKMFDNTGFPDGPSSGF